MGLFSKCDHDWDTTSKEIPGKFCLFGTNDNILVYHHKCTKCGTSGDCNKSGGFDHSTDYSNYYYCSVCKSDNEYF
jgi:hypothetical protein